MTFKKSLKLSTRHFSVLSPSIIGSVCVLFWESSFGANNSLRVSSPTSFSCQEKITDLLKVEYFFPHFREYCWTVQVLYNCIWNQGFLHASDFVLGNDSCDFTNFFYSFFYFFVGYYLHISVWNLNFKRKLSKTALV